MKIAIIGGSGAFGGFYAALFKQAGFGVTITGRDAEKTGKAAERLGVAFGSTAEAAANADVIIACVPIAETPRVIAEAAKHAKKGALLADFASVKSAAVKALRRIRRRDLELASIHPMHGPRLHGIEGQAVVFIPVRTAAKYSALVEFFRNEGARVVEATAEEHDRYAAVVQALTHFSHIATAAAIRDMGIGKEAKKFASPVYELMLGTAARIVGQEPALYAAMQSQNPFAARARKALITEARRLDKAARNAAEFAEAVQAIAKTLDVADALGKSDKAIAALYEDERRMRGCIGGEVLLQNIYSGAMHSGRLLGVSDGVATLQEGAKRVSLNASHVRLLADAEALEWRRRNAPKARRDFSFVFPKSADASAIERIACGIEGAASARVIDTFEGGSVPAGSKSITLRFEILGDVGSACAEIRRVFEGLGAKIR
jgi:prephenate dehydrogenase